MKKVLLAFSAICLLNQISSAQVWTEDFETDGNGVRYFATGQFYDLASPGNDHYGRVNSAQAANVSGAYTGQSGTFIFAGEDLDDLGGAGANGVNPKTLLFAPIDVSSIGQIELRALIATGNVGNGWDNTDTFYFEYNLDGAGWVKVMQFAAPTATTNVGMNFDADLSGLGEGAQITNNFAQFTAAIPGTGSSLELRVVTGADSGSEEFAFDLLAIWDVSGGPVLGCTDPAADNYDPNATQDDGSCQFSGCTNPLALNYDPQATNDDGSCILALPLLVINEIHYNPCATQGADVDWEFIEIYNNDVASVDLSGFTLSNGVTFTFPNGTSIAAGEYIVIASNAANYVGNGYQVFQFTGALANGGETVVLSTADPLVVDQMPYVPTAPWPTAANGLCASLELIDPSLDNTVPESFQDSYVPNGTPGAQNSVAPPPTSYTINECQTFATAGEYVTTNGIVTAVYPAASLFTIQDGTGPNSGIWVDGTGVSLGDEVDVTGTLLESFDLTLISAATYVVNSSNNPLPAAEVLGTFAINAEQWEGVLVETTAETASADLGFGEWSVDDGTGAIVVDDLGYVFAPAPLFITFTVTGPLYYSFGQFKMEPRDANDVKRWGCTDINFPNYDALAVIDDGSCGIIPGCIDPLADNFDPAATIDDGSCIYLGCDDPLALNYDPQANQNDGSCYYTLPNIVINEIHYNPCPAQGDDLLYEFVELYNAGATTADLSGYTFSLGFIFTFPDGTTMTPGEYIIVAVNAASYIGNGYQVFQNTSGNLSNNGEAVELQDGFGNVVDAVTFDDVAPWPTGPDDQCPSLELIDPSFDNSIASSWQASYVANGTPGAVNSTPPPATPYTIVQLQTIATAGEFVGTTGTVTGVYPASNLFSLQSGTGAYSGIWVDGTGISIGDIVFVEGVLVESFNLTIIDAVTITVNSSGNALPAALTLGTLAANLEAWEGVLVTATAPVENGNAGFGEWSINDGTGALLNDDLGYAFTPAPVGVTFTVTGPLYFSFNAFKVEPRDAADVIEWGCTDFAACNYSATAIIDDNSCNYDCVGCTDVNAANYNALATIDDGSCIFPGCTYPDASNYDANANQEDGSCTFVNACPADINGDNIVNTGDLLQLLALYGSTCP
jgi:hypothetical protein